MFRWQYLLTIAPQGMIRRYVAIDHEGLTNESTNPKAEMAGVIRDPNIPVEASRLLITADVISGCVVRYHQCIRNNSPRLNMLA
jgi:hypothetical protein